MIRNESGRSVIHCDRCPVRLDLGPAALVQPRLRMPSGWIRDTTEQDLCPICSSRDYGDFAGAVEPPPA